MCRHQLSVVVLLLAAGAVHADDGDDSDVAAVNANTGSEAVQQQVRLILDGTGRNTFETGDMLRTADENLVEKQGACLFDKVDAIVNEGALWEQPKETQYDVGSCCAIGNKLSCFEDVAEPYDLLGKIAETRTGVSSRGAHAAALLIKQGKKRVPSEKLTSRMVRLLEVCQQKPEECTFDKLVTFDPQRKEEKEPSPVDLVQLGAAPKHLDHEDDKDKAATNDLEDLRKIVHDLDSKLHEHSEAIESVETKEDAEADSKRTNVEREVTVAGTLEGMVGELQARSINYHYMGEMISQDATHVTSQEKMGACLLDKARAIVFEETFLEDIQQLKVNVAACCGGEMAEDGNKTAFSTSEKDRAACIEEVQPAYGLLQEVAESNSDHDPVGGKEWKENMDRAARASAYMIKAAESRIGAKKLHEHGRFLLGRCEAPQECTMQELFKPLPPPSPHAKKFVVTKAKVPKKEASLLAVETTTLVLR